MPGFPISKRINEIAPINRRSGHKATDVFIIAVEIIENQSILENPFYTTCVEFAAVVGTHP